MNHTEGIEVSYYFNGLLNDAVGIIYFSNTSGFGDAIFNTRGRSPNDLKIVSVELFVIPIEDVGIDVGKKAEVWDCKNTSADEVQ